MAQTSPPPAAPALNPAAVRIVLFGLPDAGKSSLLGALAQAAQTQEHVLNGRLVDPTQGLAELQHRLYEERPRETLEEIVPYPVTLQPFTPSGQADGKAALEAVLIDCDGRAANALLSRQDYLKPDGGLARAVFAADTLILAVDAAANSAQLDRDFAVFGRFLGLLEKSRGQRSDVGGLPVYLVLTKCDLLAQKGDTTVGWIDRIEERKRQLGQRFQQFLNRQAGHDPVPFGSIDLHLWATAVKRPTLADAPGKPREPYGVAELFRQCLESARHFQAREDRAGARLQWLLLGSLALLVLLGGLAFTLWLTQPEHQYNPLETAVDDYRSQDQSQTPRERLRGLDAKIDKLQAIRKDSAFASLAARDQNYVREQLRRLTDLREEVQDYRRNLRQLARVKPTDEAHLSELETGLKKLRPPRSFEGDWGLTNEGKEWDELWKDVRALRSAVTAAKAWYQRQVDKAKKVTAGNPRLQTVKERARRVLEGAREGPFPGKTPDMKLPGARKFTYATVDAFPTVKEKRQEWEAKKKVLQDLEKQGES
jgi:hypothetical protein